MDNLLGTKNIRTAAIEVNKNDLTKVNRFLDEHDGQIIDIQIIPMFQGTSRFIIIYQNTET